MLGLPRALDFLTGLEPCELLSQGKVDDGYVAPLTLAPQHRPLRQALFSPLLHRMMPRLREVNWDVQGHPVRERMEIWVRVVLPP